MIKLNKDDSQLVLYAKHWFKIGKRIDDLKVLTTPAFALTPDDVSEITIMVFLQDVMKKLGIAKDFTQEIIFGGRFSPKGQRAFLNFVDVALDEIGFTKISDENKEKLIELEPPDYNLLPMPKHITSEKINSFFPPA